MVSKVDFDFQTYLTDKQAIIENELGVLLSKNDPPLLFEAMRYSVLAKAKRIRSILCLAAAEAIGGNGALERAMPCACAIEFLHAFSLIHDDLPAMDNDDMRRGLPTNHKVYGEAMAILAGDALFALAVETIASSSKLDSIQSIEIISKFMEASGALGLVGGQVLDMSLTGIKDAQIKSNDGNLLYNIHARKTGALIRFSVWCGAKVAQASDKVLNSFVKYGEVLGLAFQIADDLLDVTGNAQSIGKTPGKDQVAGKITWISEFGIEGSQKKLHQLELEGVEALYLSGLDETILNPLISLLKYGIHRKK